MFKLFLIVCFLVVGRGLLAQEVAIVLTGTLYDRDLTDAESKEANDRLAVARSNGDESNFGLESIRILDARAKRLNRITSVTILEAGKSAKCAADNGTMLLYGHLEVIKFDDRTCELRGECAIGTNYGSGSLIGSVRLDRSIKFNRLEMLGSTGTQVQVKGKQQKYHLVKTVVAVPAKAHPLSSTKIGEALGDELRKRRAPLLPGKLTLLD